MTFLIASPVSPLEKTYLDSASVSSVGSSFSMPGLNFGTAFFDRYIVAVACGSADNVEVSTCTIGGVTASKLAGNANTRRASIWAAVVPTGTSGTVAITTSGTAAGGGVHLYALTPFTPTNTANLTTNGGSIVVPAAGFAIGGGMEYRGGPATMVLTGLTEDASITWTAGGLTTRFTAGSIAGTGASVTVTAGGSVAPPYGFAVSAFGA